MLPIPAATTTLTNTLVTSQPVFNEFIPYGYMEAGIIIGALVIGFIISIFAGIPQKLSAHFNRGKIKNYDMVDSMRAQGMIPKIYLSKKRSKFD